MDDLQPLSAFDWSLFADEEVELICFAKYCVVFHFSGCLLQVSDGIYFRHDAADQPEALTFPLLHSTLVRLIGISILNVRRTDSSATVIFSNGDQLQIPLKGQYESVEVTYDKVRFVGA